MPNNYRFDVRTEEEFKKDIKINSVKEAHIALRLGQFVFNNTGEWPEILPTGTDFTGEFVSKSKEVSSIPDFKIGKNLVEVTRADVICNRVFHQKQNKIIRCIKDKSDLVFVNGFIALKTPKFIWLSYKEVERFTDKALKKYGDKLQPGAGNSGFLNKAAYRYDVDWFGELWQELPELVVSKIPLSYKKILKMTGGNNEIKNQDKSKKGDA